MTKIQQIQIILEEDPDNIWGPRCEAALRTLIHPPGKIHKVKASSFADPADVAAFRRCKLRSGML